MKKSTFTFANVFNYMNEQYPVEEKTQDGENVLAEIRNNNCDDSADLESSDVPVVSSVCDSYPPGVRRNFLLKSIIL